jgi:TldD protein
VLVGYMHDRLSAKHYGIEPTGNGRRESFRSMPLPRMTNTSLMGGQDDPDLIIKSVKRGIYAKRFSGGQVNISNGDFVFSLSESYLIEDGKLTAPVKNATLIGTNLQVLKEIDMIGNDLRFFLGTCGKNGQGAPVTGGTPTFKIRQMTVGGRA